MKIHRSSTSLPHFAHGCALTVGNFDGVHLGHRAIIARLVRQAAALGCPAVLLTFWPSPEEYFRGQSAAPRITDVAARFFLLKELGLDHMVILPFNRQLAETTAPGFIRDILVDQFNPRYLLVGDDFRFGKDRIGDYELLARYADAYRYRVAQQNTVASEAGRVSSTRIRQLLAAGELARATQLLGQPYTLVGRVIYGQQRGRSWGFPTMNLAVSPHPPTTGVFAVAVNGLGTTAQPGVANLGTRPTLGGVKTLLETHLFDFTGEVYGRRICVELIEKIRVERKFDSFDQLRAQIGRDCAVARQILTAREDS